MERPRLVYSRAKVLPLALPANPTRVDRLRRLDAIADEEAADRRAMAALQRRHMLRTIERAEITAALGGKRGA